MHREMMLILDQDFTTAREKVLYQRDENTPAGLYL